MFKHINAQPTCPHCGKALLSIWRGSGKPQKKCVQCRKEVKPVAAKR